MMQQERFLEQEHAAEQAETVVGDCISMYNHSNLSALDCIL